MVGTVRLLAAFFMISVRWFFTVRFLGKASSIRARAEWMQRSAQSLADALGMRVHSKGAAPTQGLIVCNHLSYLDILVLGARHPTLFVSKAEVRSWPWIGWLTECAGTLYINREQRTDVARLKDSIHQLLGEGVPIAFFPEGTSTHGEQVLPFRASLLEPASANRCAVTPASLAYHLKGGSVVEEVCFWRDMTFGPHIWNLLSKSGIEASVVYGETVIADADRKVMAKSLHASVCALGTQHPFGNSLH
jgi:1-acyl-sn-glycerol-3-phosphate acyltransferase